MSVSGSWCRVHPWPTQVPGAGADHQNQISRVSPFASRIRSLERRDRFFGCKFTTGSYWRMSDRVMVPRFRTPSLICGRERRCAKIEMFCFHVGTVSYESLQYPRADAKQKCLVRCWQG
jgi:hypothetical protein